jgi:hypothetical protein
VTDLSGGEGKAGADILTFQIGKVGEDIVFTFSRSQQVEHILDPDSHSSETGLATTLVRIKSDSRHDGDDIGILSNAKTNFGASRMVISVDGCSGC